MSRLSPVAAVGDAMYLQLLRKHLNSFLRAWTDSDSLFPPVALRLDRRLPEYSGVNATITAVMIHVVWEASPGEGHTFASSVVYSSGLTGATRRGGEGTHCHAWP